MTNSIDVPLPDYMEQIAQRAAELAIEKHTKNCPITEVQSKVQKLEVRFGTMLGWMAGSGIAGGATVGAILKLTGA